MARAGQARAGGHTQPPVLLLALLLACCVGCLARHGAEGGGSGGDVDRATVRAARGLQSAASPSPGPATLTVSKGTGSSVSIGMVVGIAVAGGVVVGIAVGLYIAYRFHVSRRSRHTALAIPSEDVDAAEHGGAAARREAFITSSDTGRAVWDGVAPLSGAGATSTSKGIFVEVDRTRGTPAVRMTHVTVAQRPSYE